MVKMRFFYIFAFILSSVSAHSTQQTTDSFPLLGMWQAVSGKRNGRAIDPSNGGMEYDFRSDGTLFVTIQANNGETPRRIKFKYVFIKPDIVTYTFEDKATERERFSLKDNILKLEHLDYDVNLSLRRIPKTQFSVPVLDFELQEQK